MVKSQLIKSNHRVLSIEIIQHKVETYGAMFLHDYSATDLVGLMCTNHHDHYL
jgi:hypothetical protein